jgi:hypothetical protein
LFLNYKPERNIRDQEFINKRFLLYVYPRLKPFNNDYFSKRGFKNLEFCFAETLINILDEYNNYKCDTNYTYNLIKRSKYCISCNSIYDYNVLKNFEIVFNDSIIIGKISDTTYTNLMSIMKEKKYIKIYMPIIVILSLLIAFRATYVEKIIPAKNK